MPAERLPEMAGPVGFERGQELGKERVAEESRMGGDEEKANRRYETTEPLGCASVFRQHDEPADFGRSAERVTDAKKRVIKMLVERFRIFLLFENVEIDVRSVAPAELADDHRGADDTIFLRVDQGEHILSLLRVLDLAAEASPRHIDDLANRLAVVGKVHRIEMSRDGEQLVFVGRLDA